MKIPLLLLIFAASLNLSGQTANFAVHALINGATDEMPVKTKSAARNVLVGNSAVTSCYDRCDTQFILSYSGKAFLEFPGKQPEQVSADVFQIEPGVWVAELGAGQYIRINSVTGVTTIDRDGQFRLFSN